MNSESIRTRFDEILRDNIRRLLDTMPEAASLPFDIVTITSLILLVEKEKEVKADSAKESSDRYSESTLLEDLTETGLSIDEYSRTSVRNLQGMGFLSTGAGGRFVPRESTAKLVAVLDNLFPGMPGMNLVAYFLQTLDEAVSGRKEVDQAARQFEQTLISRGVPLSKSNPPREKASGTANGSKPTEKVDFSRRISNRTSNLERLRKIRSNPSSRSAEVTSVRPLTGFQKLEVVSLFPSGASFPDACKEGVQPPTAQPHDIGDSQKDQIDRIDDGERSLPLSGSAPSDEISGPKASEGANSEAVAEESPPFEGGDSLLPEPDESPAGRPDRLDVTGGEAETITRAAAPDASAEDRPMPMPLEAEPEGIADDEKIQSEALEADPVAKEEMIDLHVKQFQQALAMTCPLCREGLIHPSKTDKGKTYYSCENRDCNFISWGKPYHFSCPYCRNPFLIEYSSQDGGTGLKCPKATCNYRQEHLNSPSSETAPSMTFPVPGNAPQKGKMLVRKRLVRRKR
ncbi:MAG: hypothetical protein C4530_02845 [Desulfobacteraceae bacterium]|nr:MAG: hypothetical protein C4530_02845 [Desulfobacteraceae bacterium]